MGKKPAAIFSLIIILAFMGYMIFDASRGTVTASDTDVRAGKHYEED